MELITYQALPEEARACFYDSFFRLMAHHYNSDRLETLRGKLMDMLAPEMLLDSQNAQAHEAGHPIALARYYGLLDLTRIQRQSQEVMAASPPSSPLRAGKEKAAAPGSPISTVADRTY